MFPLHVLGKLAQVNLLYIIVDDSIATTMMTIYKSTAGRTIIAVCIRFRTKMRLSTVCLWLVTVAAVEANVNSTQSNTCKSGGSLLRYVSVCIVHYMQIPLQT